MDPEVIASSLSDHASVELLHPRYRDALRADLFRLVHCQQEYRRVWKKLTRRKNIADSTLSFDRVWRDSMQKILCIRCRRHRCISLPIFVFVGI
jgi:hypothetical protein